MQKKWWVVINVLFLIVIVLVLFIFAYRFASPGEIVREAECIDVNNVASPVKFGEYCANGVPVISTKDVGDISSYITESEIGFIVDPRDKNIAKLKLFINNVISNREEFAKKCTDFIHDRYNWEKSILEIQNIYDNVLYKSAE